MEHKYVKFICHCDIAYTNETRRDKEENLNTLLFKFSHLEIMEGSEIVIVDACPLGET